MSKLQIAEIFYSIQGEANHTGEASIFIRFYGCNLTCDFCDDLSHKDSSKKKSYSMQEVYEAIKSYPSYKIIITGGEPSIYDLNTFIKFLQSLNYYISVETNGYKFANIKEANWITYSPKQFNNMENEYCDEFKFIVEKDENIDYILNLKTSKQIYIQPKNHFHTINMENMKYCLQQVLKYPHLKLSSQLHKFLGIE